MNAGSLHGLHPSSRSQDVSLGNLVSRLHSHDLLHDNLYLFANQSIVASAYMSNSSSHTNAAQPLLSFILSHCAFSKNGLRDPFGRSQRHAGARSDRARGLRQQPFPKRMLRRRLQLKAASPRCQDAASGMVPVGNALRHVWTTLASRRSISPTLWVYEVASFPNCGLYLGFLEVPNSVSLLSACLQASKSLLRKHM